MWDPSRETDNAWATIADLSAAEHFEICETKEHISDLGASSGKLVPKGTLLMSFKLSIGKLAYAGRPLFTNEAIVALHLPEDSPVSQRFLFHYLSAIDWEQEARGNEKVKGATLNKAKLKELMIPTPSVTDQERIVALLDEATAAVAELEAVYSQTASKLDDLRASALAAAMESDDSLSVPLGDLVALKGGFAYKSKDWEQSGVPVIKIANVRDGKVSLAGCSCVSDEIAQETAQFAVVKGDLLMTLTGEIGAIGIYAEEGPARLNQRVARLDLRPGAEVSIQFLALLLESSSVRDRLWDLAQGMAQPNISPKRVAELPVVVPPRDEQERIVAHLDEVSVAVREALELATDRLEAARSFRQSVLEAAFRGEF